MATKSHQSTSLTMPSSPKKKQALPLTTKKLPTTPQRPVSKSIATVLSGGFAGTVAKTCTAPLTRVQMLSQTGAMQKSIFGTIMTVVNQKGLTNLWRGCLADCIRVFPHKSILFTVNDLLRYQMTKLAQNSSNTRVAKIMSSSGMYFVTGAIAGVVATVGTYPVDLVRCYLAGTIENKGKQTVLTISKNIYANSGIFGFYTGLGVTIAGSVPYEGIRIGVYNVLREHVPKIETNYGNEPHPIGKLVVGATAGAAAGIATYPSDTLRRMMQVLLCVVLVLEIVVSIDYLFKFMNRFNKQTECQCIMA